MDVVVLIPQSMNEVIEVSLSDEDTVRASAAARRRPAREALARRVAREALAPRRVAAKHAAKERRAAAIEAAKERRAAAIQPVAAPEAAAVAIRGPKKNGRKRFDNHCLFPNRVALVQSQVNRLKQVAMERPTKPVYVYTIVGAHIDEERANLYFTRKYSKAFISRYLNLPANIRVFRKEKPIVAVRVMFGKVKGQGVQITSNWKKVMKRTKMQEGEVFMFRFRVSSEEPGLKVIAEKLE